MKRIFIVRHGKTEWNREQRLQGANADSPLLTNDLDYQWLAEYLRHYQFAMVYSSPIKRALTTSRLVLAKMNLPDMPIQILPGLAEISFGEWEGKVRSELITNQRTLFKKMSQRVDDPGLAALGMENFGRARLRFANTIKSIDETAIDDTNVLVFSHGGISQLGIQQLTGSDRLLGLKNLSTSIIAVKDGEYYLDTYNQTGYLKRADVNEGNVSI